jgi:lipopolysaccharide export system permease protein
VRFGILERYVMGQLVRTFLLALVTITTIFSLFVIMAEATRQGLAPQEVVSLMPYLVPGSLPYTIPVAMLFAVSVIYSRIGADNEVMAIKAAGQSVWTVLNPALALGIVLSGVLFFLSSEIIPRANNMFTQIIFGSIEDGFYRLLKKEREISDPGLDFFIQVREVKGRVLIDPLIKHRAPSPPNPPDTYDMTVRAKAAQLRFDIPNQLITIELLDAETTGQTEKPFLFWINGRRALEYPLPRAPRTPERRVQQLTNGEIAETQAVYRKKLEVERKKQAAKAAMAVAAGHIRTIDWAAIRTANFEYPYLHQKYRELETEKHVRVALAAGAFFFPLLGAPVGILLARRDFLSAFITCFIPIILLYYPVVLAGINMGKEGVAPPLVVFGGDALLGLLAGFFVLPPVRKH